MKKGISSEYKDIEKILEEIKENLSIKRTVTLKIKKIVGNGSAKYCRHNPIVTIDKLIADDFEEETDKKKKDELTNVLRFLIGHELAHIKHKDPSLIKGFFSVIFKKSQAISIVKELRADIEGARAAGLSESECKEVHDYLESLSRESSTKKKIYAVGYPIRSQRIDITSKYNLFSEEAFNGIVELVIKDFCKIMKVGNQEKFIKNLREEFL